MDVSTNKINEKPAQCGADAVLDIFGEPARPCMNPNCSAIPPIGRKYCNGTCRAEASRIRLARWQDEHRRRQRDEEEKAWREFDAKNLSVWLIIVSEALAFIEMGKVPSFGAIIEYKVRLMQGVKIPNAYKKFYREKFIGEYPEYKHLFGEK